MGHTTRKMERKLARQCGSYRISCNSADFSHKISRKVDARRVAGWMNSLPGYALLLALIGTVSVSGLYGAGFRVGYKVYAGDTQIGTVTEEATFQTAMDQVHSTLEENFGKDFALQEEPYVKMGVVNIKEETTDLPEEIISSAGEISEGTAIMIDGQTAVIVPDEPTAHSVLEALLQKKREEYSETAEFAKDVTLQKQYAQTETIMTFDQALEALLGTERAEVTHLVSAGDTLSEIAERYGMTVEELEKQNPDVKAEELMTGQKLLVSKSENWMSVRTEEQFSYEEEIPFEKKTELTDELYQGDSEISQKGKNGKKKVEALKIRVDGVESEVKILNETVLEEPVTEIERQGTKERPRDVATGTFIRPTGGYLSSGFGPRWGTVHQGLDLANTMGSAIIASDGGKVTYATFNGGGYGYLVIIDHENGYETYYAHCSQLLVNVGDRVAQGDKIALVGSTGDSTGPHCHFEIRINHVPQDPAPYIL